VRAEAAPPILQLADRHLHALAGTTVEGMHDKVMHHRDIIARISRNLSVFHDKPVSLDQAAWALGVVMRHARSVLSGEGSAQQRAERLLPLVELLQAPFHPDPTIAIPLEERMQTVSSREERVLLQVARRDMQKGEEALMWLGRHSNSELALRLGMTFDRNPIGIGGKISLPANWNPGAPNTPNYREFLRYNCSSPEVFEIRLSLKGWPSRIFIRYQRIAWLLANEWYRPENTDRIQLLDKWPPPKSYSHAEWLGWTQADQSINLIISDYCGQMKRQLRETISAATADEFRASQDPTDVLLWRIRGDESKTSRECVELAKSIIVSR
jgi:hypothetical protein